MEVRCRSQCDNISYSQLLIPMRYPARRYFWVIHSSMDEGQNFVGVESDNTLDRSYRATITLPTAMLVPCVPSAV